MASGATNSAPTKRDSSTLTKPFSSPLRSQTQVLAGAVVTEGIRPGVICLHEGAWPDLDPVAGICKNGAVNVLTKDIPTSRLGNGCAGNTALAWLEKYTGPALPLTAFDPPASA